MSNLNTKILLPLFVLLLTITSCVKFEDPSLSEGAVPINYSSPCSNELNDDNSMIFTTSDSFISSFSFNNPSCTGTLIQGNPSNGFFAIILGEPISTSGTYEMVFGFSPAAGEANLQFESPGVSEPVFSSNSGQLFIELQSDGTTIVEWCDVICQAGSGIPNRKSSGRMICD